MDAALGLVQAGALRPVEPRARMRAHCAPGCGRMATVVVSWEGSGRGGKSCGRPGGGIRRRTCVRLQPLALRGFPGSRGAVLFLDGGSLAQVLWLALRTCCDFRLR